MRLAAWALLALAGQLATLLLTHAGHNIGYQHFTPLAGSGPGHAALQAVLVVQALIVLVAVWSRRGEIRGVLAALAPGWRLAAVLVCFVLTSATLSRNPRDYVIELLFAAPAEALQLITVAFAAAALAAGARARLRAWTLPAAGEAVEPGGIDAWALPLAIWTTLVAALLAVFSYQRMPHIPDEVVYLLHARYFAHGMLTMPAPPVPDAFNLDLMSLEHGRWFTPVPPGWPAILALGVIFGVPWLVNPLLAGACVLLASALLREIYPRRTARLALVLLAASPWALLMGMSLLTHCLSDAAFLVAALAVARQRRGGSPAWGLLGGAMIGMLTLVRPLEGFIVAIALGLWSLTARWRGVPLLQSAVLTAATALVTALNLPYNKALTGNARTFPLMAYSDKVFGPGTNSLGFGPNRGLGWNGLDPYPGHGLRDVIVNTNLNVFQINIELLGWSCGSLIAIWLLFSAGRLRRADWWMLAFIGAVLFAHAFYWFSGGPDFGARYWFLVLVPCLALAARGIESADAALDPAGGSGTAVGAAALLALLAMLVFIPWRGIDKYYHYRGMRPDIRALAKATPFGADLVLVRGARHPDYHGAAVFNPVDLHAPKPVYAWDRGPETDSVLFAAYPGRRVWILAGPTLTHDSYQVLAGPLSGPEALRRIRTPDQP